MGDAGDLHAGEVPGGAGLAGEVQDRLVGVGEVLGEEPAAVGLGEDAGVAPALAGCVADLLRDRAEIEDVDDEQVAGFGALDGDRPGEHVGAGEVDVANVVGGVVVADLAVGPFAALDADRGAGPHGGGGWDVGVPAVVAGYALIAHGPGLVDGEHDVGHEHTSLGRNGSFFWRAGARAACSSRAAGAWRGAGRG